MGTIERNIKTRVVTVPEYDTKSSSSLSGINKPYRYVKITYYKM